VTHLRQKMLDELQRRNYSQKRSAPTWHAVEEFARYFHRSPDRLGLIISAVSGLSVSRTQTPGRDGCMLHRGFTFSLRPRRLRRPYLPEHIPFPKRPSNCPSSSVKRGRAVIDSAENLSAAPW